MRRLLILIVASFTLAAGVQTDSASSIRIVGFNATGTLTWTNNASLGGLYAIEASPTLPGAWSALDGLSDIASTQAQVTVTVPVGNTNGPFYRVVWKDAPVADSAGDYSSTQGENGWFYGYSDTNNTFTLLPRYGGFINSFSAISTNWNLDGTNSWLLLDQFGGHPEGIICGRLTNTLSAVRRWVSTVAGTVQVSATLKDLDTGGGNGVAGSIVVDGVTVISRSIGDGGSTNFTTPAIVSVGSTVDCVLDAKNGDECYDYTLFRITIRP